MLDRQSRSPGQGPLFEPPPSPPPVEIGLPQLLAFLRRQRWVIAAAVAVALVLGVAYLAVTPPSYTAASTVLIDPRKVAIFGSGNVLEDASITNSGVETQVQVLQSGRIARAVVDKLKLADDADFMATRPSPLSIVRGWLPALKALVLGPGTPSATGAAAEADPAVAATGVLLGHMTASRVGLSYVINVSYVDDDPARAAKLANAITDAYLDDQLNTQVTTAQRASEWLQGRLADLQNRSNDNALSAQEKSAIRATYDSFLERYTQMVQQQSMPFADAQVLTAATPPSKRTSPNTIIVLLGAIVVGGGIGFAAALARELLDRSIRTRQQVEAATGAPFLGFLPAFDIKGRSMRKFGRSRKPMDAATLHFAPGPAYSVGLTAPFSRYAETLRSAKVAAESGPNGPLAVIGVVSALPNEGRSTVAINLARLIAQSGARPLLIDGDMRNPTLSRDLVPANVPGLAQVVAGTARISDVIWTDESTSLQFIAAGAGQEQGKDANGILAAQATRAVINACRQQYDVVIVDLPATLPVVDVRAAAHLFDGFLLVAEWGYVTEDILGRGIQAGGLEDRIIGVVLNKVNVRQLRRFDSANPAAVPSGNYLRSYSHIG